MCSVDPANVNLLINFGTFMFVAGIVSLVTGATYFRGVIYRSDDPSGFWTSTISFLLLGGMTLLGVWLC